MNRNECSNYLKHHGIKPSLQRIKIFEFLVKQDNHPTVDHIYRALMDDIPTLSKTTVYNTLNLFVENKIVKTLTIEDNEMRYDAILDFHGHFKCTSCGSISDFPINLEALNLKGLENIEIDEVHFYVKGKCSTCIKQN